MEWQDLQKIYDAARRAGVGWSLDYSEADGSFYFVVSSIAPSENFVGKSNPLPIAIEHALEWLESITP